MTVPFVKDFSFEYGQLVRVSPLVRRLTAENPGPFTYTGTNVFVIGRGRIAVIDPGPAEGRHVDVLLDALAGETVAHILITHTHRDHCGAAATLAARTGAPIYAFPGAENAPHAEAPKVDEGTDRTFRSDVHLVDGAVISEPEWTIEVVHTPGHVSGHLCYALREEKALFTGDHVMGWATSVVIPPDGDMDAYMASLQKLIARDDAIYYPTHGAAVTRPAQYARALLAHRRMRDRQILDQLQKGRTQIKEIVAALYADLDPRLHVAAALSVHAHLLRLAKAGRAAAESGDASLDGVWRLAHER